MDPRTDQPTVVGNYSLITLLLINPMSLGLMVFGISNQQKTLVNKEIMTTPSTGASKSMVDM
jgi:hypothetical protein